jgi:hypothetical protein
MSRRIAIVISGVFIPLEVIDGFAMRLSLFHWLDYDLLPGHLSTMHRWPPKDWLRGAGRGVAHDFIAVSWLKNPQLAARRTTRYVGDYSMARLTIARIRVF